LDDRLFKYYHDKFRKNVDKIGVKGKLEELRRNTKTRLETARKGIDTFLEEISSNRKEELAFKGKGAHILLGENK